MDKDPLFSIQNNLFNDAANGIYTPLSQMSRSWEKNLTESGVPTNFLTWSK